MTAGKESRLSMETNMEYILCEDWLVYARTDCGEVYWASTEMWPDGEHLECDEMVNGAINRHVQSYVQLKGEGPKWRHCEISGSCTDCPERGEGCDLPVRSSQIGSLH